MTYTKEDAIRITDEQVQFNEWLEGRIRTLIDTGIYEVTYVEHTLHNDSFYITWETSYGQHTSISIDWAELADETGETYRTAQAERDRVKAEQQRLTKMRIAGTDLERARKRYDEAVEAAESAGISINDWKKSHGFE